MTRSASDLERLGRADVRERLAVLAILFLGTGLRLFRLGGDSLWYDETVSTYLAGSPVAELLRHTAGDIHPPGYYLFLRAWLILAGYPAGRAEPHGNGLEWVSGFFSLFFGVLMIVIVYALARQLAGRRIALAAAVLLAISPFNIWYSQEVRMYTLGAGLGLAVLWTLLAVLREGAASRSYAFYALAAAAGMYVLYYFAFLLVPLNLWVLIALVRRRRSVWPLILANIAAAMLYIPWLGIAFRQATQPPVPPWRAAPDLPAALLESWNALSFGQSAPGWIWPALLLTLLLYAFGLRVLARRRGIDMAVSLAVATLGPLFLILVISSIATPLYHVRYLFTYSPAFYVVAAAGLVSLGRRSRQALLVTAAVLVLAMGISLREFWCNPAFAADDHRAAVRELRARWRPGDVVLVNAGWAYTALVTYWDGEIGGRYRVTGALPEPRSDAALIMVTTGSTDGDPQLGWGDPRSDFFAMPSEAAKAQVSDLFDRFTRVWQYRIYDTVNDPDGLIRALFQRHGQIVDDRLYPGDSYLRLQLYVPRRGVDWNGSLPGAMYEDSLQMRFEPLAATAAPGATLYPSLVWRPEGRVPARIATSLRLVRQDGETIYQPGDEWPLGPDFFSDRWPPGVAQPQSLALTIPDGTPPGNYRLVLVVYAAETGQPFLPGLVNGSEAAPPGLLLGKITVADPGSRQNPDRP